MRHDVYQVVEVTLNHEIKTPASINPGLPDIPCLIIFFCLQRGMTEVIEKKDYLSVKSLLDAVGSACVGAEEVMGTANPH